MHLSPANTSLDSMLSRLLGEDIKIQSRRSCEFASTFPVEIVTCQFRDELAELFCKFSGNIRHSNIGRKGGVIYEGKVYKEVLSEMELTTPHFYGAAICEGDNEQVIVLEYLRDSDRVALSKNFNQHMQDAASWAGTMHRIWESRAPAFLVVYDKAFYQTWADRLRIALGKARQPQEWFENILCYFEKHIDALVSVTPTVIHAEYYPDNIHVRGNLIYPVDWESAAAGAAEVDLASLAENWPEPMVNQLIHSYTSARWPDGRFSMKDFRKRLLMAEIYFYIRWVGDGDHFDIEPWLKNPVLFSRLERLSRLVSSC